MKFWRPLVLLENSSACNTQCLPVNVLHSTLDLPSFNFLLFSVTNTLERLFRDSILEEEARGSLQIQGQVWLLRPYLKTKTIFSGSAYLITCILLSSSDYVILNKRKIVRRRKQRTRRRKGRTDNAEWRECGQRRARRKSMSSFQVKLSICWKVHEEFWGFVLGTLWEQREYKQHSLLFSNKTVSETQKQTTPWGTPHLLLRVQSGPGKTPPHQS